MVKILHLHFDFYISILNIILSQNYLLIHVIHKLEYLIKKIHYIMFIFI